MNPFFTALMRHAQHHPSRIALHGDGQTVLYASLPLVLAPKVAILRQAQVKVLGLQLQNSIDWVLWDLAALCANVICVPLPSFFTAQQMDHAMSSAGVDACVTEEGLQLLNPLPAAAIPLATSKITFTSGTTGEPKGVCLPATVLYQLPMALAEAIGPEYGERHLSVMPLSILLENIAGVYTALIAGAEVFVPSPATIGMDQPFRTDFGILLDFIAKHRITSLILTPELLSGLVGAAREHRRSASSLRFIAVGGATVSPALLHAARDAGLPVYEGYGLSECGSVVALNTPAAHSPGTVGTVLPHVTVDIQDGEIIVKNPGFLGYLGDEPRTAGTDYHTGDNGFITPDGVLSITGRRKNTIITAQGRNIAPEWVEAALVSHPAIAQAFVYGEGFSFPHALLVPRGDPAALETAVKQVNQGLPVYAQISDFHVVQPFTPRNGMLTASGRLRRQSILTTYQTLISGDSHGVLRQAG